MSMRVGGSGSPDIVQLLVMRKAMSVEQTASAQLLKALQPAPVASAAAPATGQRTFWL